jgi:hypothetical protein
MNMTTKFSTNKRSIFPPPVCKKVPPYPPMPDIPPNAIIVQIIENFDDDVDRHWVAAGVCTIYLGDEDIWFARLPEPIPGWMDPELRISEDGKFWWLSIVKSFVYEDERYIEIGPIPSGPGNPFHASPTSLLEPDWTGSITVELTSA